jgi:hypothetical protein
MSVQPETVMIGTSWPGPFCVDDLLVTMFGAADVPLDLCSGTLKPSLVSATYAANVITLQFLTPSAFGPGGRILPAITIIPTLELGTSALVAVAVESINTTAQTVGIRFTTPAGAVAQPPIVSTNAKLHLAVFRPLPLR